MVSEDYKVGDLVWAKMKGYPPWPARIAVQTANVKPPKNKKAHFVFFFGSENYAWILDENISPHSESILSTLKKKSGPYQNAVDALIKYSSSMSKEKQGFMKKKKEKIQNEDENSQKKIVNSIAKKHKKKVFSHKPALKTLKRPFYNMNGGRSACSPSKARKLPQYDCSPVHSFMSDFPSWGNSQEFYEKYLNNANDTLDRKHVNPSQQRFGFIGLGQMGRNIVRNMIESGHNVTVWNRRMYKCNEFVQLGAKIAQNPSDLVVECDVTFCCVSDPDASKALIFGERGILKGLEQAEKAGQRRKGYVEMTSMDPESSIAISEAIIRKHGLYLEAPVCGTSTDAEEGTLLVVASGDRRVFTQCETCFHAIGKHAFYLTCEIGYSLKITLFLSMLSGTMCEAVAEAMVLAERLNVSTEDFLDLLCFGPLNYDNLIRKMEVMRDRVSLQVPLVDHTQKDINFALILANDFSQPMPVTAAANEVYKLARLLKHSKSDADKESKYLKY